MSVIPGYEQTKGGLYAPIDIHAAETSLSDLRNPQVWLTTWAGGQSVSGTTVTATTAMGLPAYYACIRNISEDIAKLPLITYRRLQPRGKERMDRDGRYFLLQRQPNPYMTAITLREVLTHHALGWGNGYAEIVRDNTGRVTALYPIHPSRVRIRFDEDAQLVYDVAGTVAISGAPQMVIARFRQEEILHIKGLGSEGYEGYSVLTLGLESLGLSLAAQEFGGAFFGNGASLGGVLEHPRTLSATAREHLRLSWQERYGGAGAVGRTALLEEGMKYTSIGIPPEQAQYLETREFQAAEIARWFRMPLHKIQVMDGAKFANIEHQAQEYVVDTLMPWLVRWEQEIDRKLYPEPDLFAEHLVLGLLRGDSQTRAQYYTARFKLGTLSPNDIRELENENPVGPGGDEYFIEGNNFVPLRSYARGQEPFGDLEPAEEEEDMEEPL